MIVYLHLYLQIWSRPKAIPSSDFSVSANQNSLHLYALRIILRFLITWEKGIPIQFLQHPSSRNNLDKDIASLAQVLK